MPEAHGSTDPLSPAAVAQRVSALEACGLPGGPADPELLALVRVAAAVAGVRTAAVNLIGADSQHSVATAGFEGADSPAADSLCVVGLAQGGTVHVPDALRHPAFAANPWVDGRRARVRAYAAVPLVLPHGVAVGTLCAFDTVPSPLAPAQLERLEDLAQVVVALLERRRQAREAAQQAEAADEARALLELAHAEIADRGAELAATNAELQRSNAELEAFAAVASHDLRAPLTVVDGYLELVADVYGDRLDRRALDWIATARGGAARMASLIETLLGHATAGGRDLVREPVDLQGVLDLALHDLRTEVDDAGARVVVDGRLPTVVGDAVQLRQLLQNLLANAVKFRRPDRPVEVTCAALAGEDSWTVSVADNGPGIPAARREAVFGMFERASAAQGAAGTGIGLATCERIVTRHGGRIWAAETPGGGATVCFTVPDTTLAVALPQRRPAAGELTVLLPGEPDQSIVLTQAPGAPRSMQGPAAP